MNRAFPYSTVGQLMFVIGGVVEVISKNIL